MGILRERIGLPAYYLDGAIRDTVACFWRTSMTIESEQFMQPIVLAAGQGRHYYMGRMSAVFKADGHETKSKFSVSEWWLEPKTPSPGVHHHPDDHVFYVL